LSSKWMLTNHLLKPRSRSGIKEVLCRNSTESAIFTAASAGERKEQPHHGSKKGGQTMKVDRDITVTGDKRNSPLEKLRTKKRIGRKESPSQPGDGRKRSREIKLGRGESINNHRVSLSHGKFGAISEIVLGARGRSGNL